MIIAYPVITPTGLNRAGEELAATYPSWSAAFHDPKSMTRKIMQPIGRIMEDHRERLYHWLILSTPYGAEPLIRQMLNGTSEVTAWPLELMRQVRAAYLPGRIVASVSDPDGRNIPVRQADKVLLDAPCTGLGVLSKRVDLRWRRKEPDLSNIVKLQKELLNSAAPIIKPGGILVYSTCTIEPEENENVIGEFLEKHKDFCIDDAGSFVNTNLVDSNGYVKTFPHIHSLDGSFSARLVKFINTKNIH